MEGALFRYPALVIASQLASGSSTLDSVSSRRPLPFLRRRSFVSRGWVTRGIVVVRSSVRVDEFVAGEETEMRRIRRTTAATTFSTGTFFLSLSPLIRAHRPRNSPLTLSPFVAHDNQVKCDASRPFCTPCLKSSRGDSALALTRCKYEGTSVAAAREAAAAAREAGGGVGGGGRKKRKVEGEEGEGGRKGKKVGVEAMGWNGQGGVVDAGTFAAFDPRMSGHGHAGTYSTQLPPPPGYPTALPPHPPPGSTAPNTLAEPFRPLPPPLAPSSTSAPTLPPALAYDSKPSSAGTGTGAESVKKEVVEGLEGRIAELERQLRAREAAANGSGGGAYYAPAANGAPHTRSPSFPYAFPAQPSAAYTYPGATYPSSLPPPLSSASSAAPGIPFPSPSSAYPTQPLTPGAHTHAYPPIQLAPPGGGSSPRTGRSLSALSAAAAAGIEDFPGWSAQESNLRSSVPPPQQGWTAAAQSPMSSLRYSALPAADGGEGFVLSPRGSLARERERGTPVFAVVGAAGGAASKAATSAGAGGGGSTRPGSSSSATSPHSSATTSSSSPPKADPTTFSALDDFSLSPELYALLHPSYPPSLPPIATVHHLVQTFFLRAKIPAQMLNHRNILESMLYGPADPRWPDEALLHAMCAFAAQYVSEESLGSLGPYATSLGLEMDREEEEKRRKSRYWERDGTKTARAYHYMHAKRSVHEAVDSDLKGAGKPRDMLQVRLRRVPRRRWTVLMSERARRSSKRASSPATSPTNPPRSPTSGSSAASPHASARPSA